MAWEKFEYGEKQISNHAVGSVPPKVRKMQGYAPLKGEIELNADANFLAVAVHKHAKSGYLVHALERPSQTREGNPVEFKIPNREKLLSFLRINGVKLVQGKR